MKRSSPDRYQTQPLWPAQGLRYGRLLTLITVLILLPLSARAEPVTLNLKGADIEALINLVSQVTGRNFVIDPRVKAQVTVVSSHPIEKDQLYEIFLSVLEVHGFTAVASGDIVKILPDVKAKQNAVPLTDELPPGDTVITQVIRLENVNATQLVPFLRPLIPQQGHLGALANSNVLVITDRASNVRRILEIIRRVDVASDNKIDIIPLKHASASEVARILDSIYAKSAGKGAGGQPSVRIVADDRTNSVLLSGDPTQRTQLHRIIAELDTPLASAGNTHVVYLHYAKAADLVPVLQGISDTLAEERKKGQQKATTLPISIQADETSNALVITAPPDIYRSLSSVIRKLDIRRAQVLVETIIAEIAFDKKRELGTQWVFDASPSGAGPVGVINFGGSNSIVAIGGALDAGTPPALGEGAFLGIGQFDSDVLNFGVLVNALANDANSNILSTPSLVTLDNQEAEVVVGKTVPFVTGSYTTTGTTGTPGNPFQTIERQDIGLTLKVTPQINEGNAIKLDIEQEISSISNSSAGAVDLVTDKRSIRTTVMVDDGQVVVLYGLLDDSVQELEQRVPVLGDLPVLGHLFRYNSSNKIKRNLVVFLRPRILRDSQLHSTITAGKYNYLRAQQLQIQRDGILLMEDERRPLLPENIEDISDPREYDRIPPTTRQPDASTAPPARARPVRQAAHSEWWNDDAGD
ncbi:MAG TPA: type II secretion system protein GspD [Thiotrichales bacterium]|nr:type II secretion system protein GspD [Thiotrichales bacterium]